ncbi:flavin reductase family protein [Cypionkella psychrotolerans]|uniref:flavin reductase family protein n=1 Tax=Cypionkella psychrotolerans TaxID=1678131 RepID=UPI0006B64B2B|nr:flavin reductase family protein [Cypionkella psychrotolerans]
MRWDLDKVAEPIAYKLLAATVMPRPIAWVVTQSHDGKLNAAPYSFFNVMGSAPPTLVLGLMADPTRGFKDTAANILATGEFVVNLVPEALVQQMNTTSVDAPTGVNELNLAGLETEASVHIRPPRIAASPVAFECRMLSSVVTGPHQTIVIGRVLAAHIDDRFILNAERAHIDTPALNLVARSYGSTYVRSHDTFELDRPKWAEWSAKNLK